MNLFKAVFSVRKWLSAFTVVSILAFSVSLPGCVSADLNVLSKTG